jgi:predicted transcriptional regulator of viral defense system
MDQHGLEAVLGTRGHRERLLELVREDGVIRAKEAKDAGIPTAYLTRLVRTGDLERVGRGLYTLANADSSEYTSLIETAKIAPKAIICLLSAAAYFELTTQVPRRVWVALPAGTKAPTSASAELAVMHEGPAAYGEGVIEQTLGGAVVPMYGPSKTVADLFKFRRRVGVDVALEVLTEYWRSEHRKPKKLRRYLEINSVTTVVEPYLEILAT